MMERAERTDANLNEETNQRLNGVSLGDYGILFGAVIGLGLTLIYGDTDSGSHVVNFVKDFANNGVEAVVGSAGICYIAGRLIDAYSGRDTFLS